MSGLKLPAKGSALPVTATTAPQPDAYSVKHSWHNADPRVEDAIDDYCKVMRRQLGRRVTFQELATVAITELLRSRGFL